MSTPSIIGNQIFKFFGLLLIVASLYAFAQFPTHQTFLFVITLGLICIGYLRPLSWLITLPVITVSLDLTQYSGRFLINEYDYLLWAVAGTCYLRQAVDLPKLKENLGVAALLFLFVIFTLISSHFWQIFEFIGTPLSQNPYYSNVYGAKLAKGVIWAVIYVPIVSWAIKQVRFVDYMACGILLSSTVLLVTILWERGILATFWQDGVGYGLINSLLNSSSSYRTTGIFSDMHTGGEVIDGVILLLLPFTIYCSAHNTARIKVAGLISAVFVMYVVFAGFTRATYAATFITFITFFAMWVSPTFKLRLYKIKPFTLPIISFILILYLGISLIGIIAIVYVVGTIAVSWGSLKYLPRKHFSQVGLIAFTVGISLYLTITDHFQHKWIDVTTLSLVWLGVYILLFPSVVYWVSQKSQPLSVKPVLVSAIVLIPVLILTKQMLGGYQINDRAENIETDLETRFAHWSRVLESGQQDLFTSLFGNGIGSFPANYLTLFPETIKEIGSFQLISSDHGSALQLGGAQDMSVAQRVTIEPDTQLLISARIKNPEKASLGVCFCERNIIFAQNTARHCAHGKLNSETLISTSSAGLEEHKLLLQSNNLSNRILKWPVFFHLKNSSIGKIVEVYDVHVGSPESDMLSNPDFDRKIDHWFFYNDFAHLPWHIKNTYLHWYYELGVIGLAMILALILLAMLHAKRHGSLIFFAAVTAGLTGNLMIWLFGTPMDSVRVSMWFYLILFMLVFTPKKHEA